MTRDYAAICNQYAEGVVAGLIPAGSLVVAACARHLSDLDRARKGWDYRFDARCAAHMCGYVEQLPHVKGDLRGQPMLLEPFEVFILANLNGWRRAVDGRRRFRMAYIELPRKNGKSTLMAPVLLYLATADGEPGPEVYTAATKMAQARIVFDLCRSMAKMTPLLMRETGMEVWERQITARGDSFIRPLEAKKLDGLNPHGAGIDELHEHRDRVVFDALADALGARTNPLLISITTAGQNLAHICYEQHLYVKKILNRVYVDESYFGIIYALDEEDDPFDEEAWPKANPNLGVSKRIDYMRDRAAQATVTPAQMGEYLRKHCGIWTREGATAIPLEGWRAGGDPGLSRDDFRGAGGILGLDLALRDDFASLAWVLEGPDGGWTVFCDHFATEDSLRKPGRETQLGWASAGLIEMHAGASMDLGRIEEVAMARAEQFGCSEIAIDPHLGAQMAMRLENEGYPVVEMRQTPMNLSPAFQKLIALATDGKVRHDGDPVLEWMVSNAVERRRGDFSVPDKLTGGEKIDGVSAIITAAARIEAPEGERPNLLTSDKIIARGGLL